MLFRPILLDGVAVEQTSPLDGPGAELPTDGVHGLVQRGLPLVGAILKEIALNGRIPRQLRGANPPAAALGACQA